MTQSYGKISVAQIRIDYLPCYIFFVVFVPKSVGLEWFVVPKSVLKIVMVVPKNVFVADFQSKGLCLFGTISMSVFCGIVCLLVKYLWHLF